jgi:hypothetical protein
LRDQDYTSASRDDSKDVAIAFQIDFFASAFCSPSFQIREEKMKNCKLVAYLMGLAFLMVLFVPSSLLAQSGEDIPCCDARLTIVLPTVPTLSLVADQPMIAQMPYLPAEPFYASFLNGMVADDKSGITGVNRFGWRFSRA